MIKKSDKTRFLNILDQMEDWLNLGYQRPLSARSLQDEEEKDATTGKLQTPPMPPPVPPPVYEFKKEDWPEGGSIDDIGTEILQCQRCTLYLTRNNLVVPGVGTPEARLMVVTPPPVNGASEKSGPLGKKDSDYLKKWLEALELDPFKDVFITPLVKCRTPAGRPPLPVESSTCLGYLHRQFYSIAPKAVLILGSSAASVLLGSEGSFSSMVGKLYSWNGVPAMVLWEPREVLFHPSQLRKPVWEALKKLKASWNALP